MARRKYVSPGMIDYKGHAIGLTDEGRIECAELGIVGDTLDEVKKAIRATETKVAKLPMVDVWFKYGYGNGYTLIQGKTNQKRVGWNNNYVWVSYKDDRGKNHREKVYVTNTFLDTSENRELIERLNYLAKSKSDLEDDIDEIMGKLEIVGSDDED